MIIFHSKITVSIPTCTQFVQGSTPDDLPSWMACIQKKLLDNRTHLNVQLFLTRLITHRPKVCQHITHILSQYLSVFMNAGFPAICQVLAALSDQFDP